MCMVQFTKYKDMQRLLELDRAAWDEQHKTTGRRGAPAGSFNLGSMIGGVANAIRGVGGNAQPPQSDQQDAVATSEQPAQQDTTDTVVLADEDPVWTDNAPHPVRSPFLAPVTSI